MRPAPLMTLRTMQFASCDAGHTFERGEMADTPITRKLARTSPANAAQAPRVEAPVKALPIEAPKVRQSDAPPARPGIMARL